MSMAKFRKVKNNRKNSPTRGMIYGRAVVNRVVHTSAIARISLSDAPLPTRTSWP